MFNQQFIRDFAQLSEPLVLLLSNVPFKWGLVKQNALEALKATFEEAFTLVYTAFEKKDIIYTDASKLALGPLMTRIDKNGNNNTVAMRPVS